jgi:hypothetical protein
MRRNWARQIAGWLQRETTRAAGRRLRGRRRICASQCAALISQLEIFESRQLLTNLVTVHVQGSAIHLKDVSGSDATNGDNFSISYTSSQVVLTATSDTSFKVGKQTLTTDTIDITSPPSIKLRLNRNANVVTIDGDGTASLSGLNVKLGTGLQNNSLTLTNVITDSFNVRGGRHDDSVTLNESTVNGNLNAVLGHSSGDVLDLESTTVGGKLSDRVAQLIMNQSTVTGKLHDVEPGKNSTLTSTDSTYTGAASIKMGRSGVVNWESSADGSNEFHSAVTIGGASRFPTTINQADNSVVFDVTPKYRHATVSTSSTTLATPTVNSQTITTNTAPVITGTYDATATALTVTANGNMYTLGTDPQLTAPSTGQWSLDLSGATLTSPVTTVTVVTTDGTGGQTSGTGTITDGAAIISNYLTANNLTASQTADGLNYVIKTAGTGATPTAGQTVTVNYSGFLLNSDATRGTEFDSNTDASFGHVSPFSFTLGAGQVIAGWDEAFALLPVGTVAELIIPSALAYGTQGSGTTIPPNSILIFDVTVVSAA